MATKNGRTPENSDLSGTQSGDTPSDEAASTPGLMVKVKRDAW